MQTPDRSGIEIVQISIFWLNLSEFAELVVFDYGITQDGDLYFMVNILSLKQELRQGWQLTGADQWSLLVLTSHWYQLVDLNNHGQCADTLYLLSHFTILYLNEDR